ASVSLWFIPSDCACGLLFVKLTRLSAISACPSAGSAPGELPEHAMGKKRSDRIDSLPPEVPAALGKPLSVHPPYRWLAWLGGSVSLDRIGYWAAGALFLVMSPILLAMYFFGQFQPGDPVWAFALASGVCLMLAVSCALYAALRPAPATKDRPQSPERPT